jgi:hypothetical protein
MVEINPVQLIVSSPGSGTVSPPSELIRSSLRSVESVGMVAEARGRIELDTVIVPELIVGVTEPPASSSIWLTVAVRFAEPSARPCTTRETIVVLAGAVTALPRSAPTVVTVVPGVLEAE